MTQDERRLPEIVERPPGKGSRADFYVAGSDLVRVPAARTNEFPKANAEHHEPEAERTSVAYLHRVI